MMRNSKSVNTPYSGEQSPLLINNNTVEETGQQPVTDSKQKATTIGAYFTFVNGFIGGGLLGLPYGFKEGGLFACAVGLIILAFISNYTVRLLAYIKTTFTRYNIQSYADIGNATFGKVGSVLVNTSVIISQIGYCCAYLVFIGKNLSTLTFMPAKIHPFEISLIVLPIILGLVFLKNMKYLSPTSIVANFAVISAVVAVLEYGFTHEHIADLHEYKPYLRIGTFPVFYGIVAFGYTIHGLALDIQSSMREPSKYDLVANLSMAFVTVIYLVFGGLSYLFFKENTNSVITLNLENGIENDIIKLSLAVVLVFAFPLQMFPVIKILEGAIFPPVMKPLVLDYVARYAFRIVLTVACLVVALEVKLFGLFSSLVGTFSNSFIAFIFPPLAYLILSKREHHYIPIWKWILCITIIMIGIAGMLVGSAVIIKDIIEALKSGSDN